VTKQEPTICSTPRCGKVAGHGMPFCGRCWRNLSDETKTRIRAIRPSRYVTWDDRDGDWLAVLADAKREAALMLAPQEVQRG
jgi:hypothetical protein